MDAIDKTMQGAFEPRFNTRTRGIIFPAVCAMLIGLNICRAAGQPDRPFHSSDEANSVIPQMIKSFVSDPSEFGLGRIDYLCMRVPDDTRKGRDVKLTLMLQFLTMIDSVREERVPPVGNYPITPSSWGAITPGAPPEEIRDPVIRNKYAVLVDENTFLIHRHNIQSMLVSFRRKYFQFVPSYIEYKYTSSEKDHVQGMVKDQLKNDPRAKDLVDRFLAAEPLLPPESMPSE